MMPALPMDVIFQASESSKASRLEVLTVIASCGPSNWRVKTSSARRAKKTSPWPLTRIR